ncbi:2-keto-4-pentenoate hydratase/2-oxohepta-3-ene-1,7-dioic acid hydratase [Sphaerochaeta pleomorpha str. Grapes]|uniref:2-keto-4-pentenoate hydratase/2-oxohepta-3-ene-1,7-dioic acid hydratase n=1 Tax=Sphaerochaeta pleomorpha (strain ATCC BAA-1885 / DSM 22778 / Grapes) TaxID=158190 RepID=G8QXK5_SPHPG|nr:fumarylacetoacetate hydrolase family protein [Sphaerochaeta pleomorpha]AEV29568.1 2-keto-4-pentenoate hydratase/2-oxohepta-3-ene-1,7-dioic acid hydratase [Sphaerochaeta pleomorpha str. Grapes]
MKYLRFSYQDSVHYGILQDNTVQVLDGSPFGSYTVTDKKLALDKVKILTPCNYTKAVCIGLNYRDHAEEFQLPIPTEPVVFIKPSTASLDPLGTIVYPPQCHRLDYEAELAIVIGKKAKNIEEQDVKEYILGYTCANDITARDLQPKQGQWTVAKSFDTFCPFGPFISDEVNPSNLVIESRVNGKTMQKSNSKHLIFSVPFLVSYLSKVMTLLPGDIILTGTPGGISGMHKGDTVEIIIEGLGTLKNTIG